VPPVHAPTLPTEFQRKPDFVTTNTMTQRAMRRGRNGFVADARPRQTGERE